MALFRRTRPNATASVVRPVATYHDGVRAQRETQAATDAERLDKMADVYYLALGLYRHRSPGNTDFSTMRLGEMRAATDCIAILLNTSPITIAYRLERGLPLDGTQPTEPDSEVRVEALCREALRRDNHPMYTIIYEPSRIGI